RRRRSGHRRGRVADGDDSCRVQIRQSRTLPDEPLVRQGRLARGQRGYGGDPRAARATKPPGQGREELEGLAGGRAAGAGVDRLLRPAPLGLLSGPRFRGLSASAPAVSGGCRLLRGGALAVPPLPRRPGRVLVDHAGGPGGAPPRHRRRVPPDTPPDVLGALPLLAGTGAGGSELGGRARVRRRLRPALRAAPPRGRADDVRDVPRRVRGLRGADETAHTRRLVIGMPTRPT